MPPGEKQTLDAQDVSTGSTASSGVRGARKRRKDDRPGEIIEAAAECFLRNGFARTRLEDIAKAAGTAKGNIFRYFSGKEDLFRAVAHSVMTYDLSEINAAAAAENVPFAVLLPTILNKLAGSSSQSRIPAFSRLIVEEARLFPELAAAWHKEVSGRAINALAQIIAAAQARGEIRQGDPRLFALSITAPLHTAAFYDQVFGQSADTPHFDIGTLARQHAETLLEGMMLPKSAGKGKDDDA